MKLSTQPQPQPHALPCSQFYAQAIERYYAGPWYRKITKRIGKIVRKFWAWC